MTISSELRKLQLISENDKSKSNIIFDEMFSDILEIHIANEENFIAKMWERWEAYHAKTNVLNGQVFEILLATLLYRSGITPLFVQAQLCYVPNVNFDFVAYSQEFGPIILSAKVSLRERYKQADLEGMMLRQVHRQAKSYLITMNKSEAESVNRKIEQQKVLGIDRVYVASNQKFNDLMKFLGKLNYIYPPKIDVINSSRMIALR